MLVMLAILRRWSALLVVFAALVFAALVSVAQADDGLQPAIDAALEKAGENKPQIEQALRDAPADQQPGMRFLVAHMPDRDLTSLTAEFLLTNVEYAYRARNESAWKDKLPEEVFLNDVLPYANINERRDDWRKDFYDRFHDLVKDVDSPGLAAAKLNQQIFGIVNVKYSTQRRKADQSPYESMETGLASCTGLSIILVDACRAVGIPARVVGTPRWTDNSGNHTWVEVWDDGWHFTGACEANGDKLDSAWFIDRASQALRDDPRHAIFAVSYAKTDERFPLIWDRRADYVSGVNVTDNYTKKPSALAEGTARVFFKAVAKDSEQRVPAVVRVTDADGACLFVGVTKDESADANDHLAVTLPLDAMIDVSAFAMQGHDKRAAQQVKVEKNDQLVALVLDDATPAPAAAELEASASRGAVEALANYLAQDRDARPKLDEQPFTKVPLSRADADAAAKLLADDHKAWIRKTRAEEVEKREIVDGELKMPFFYEVFGEKPEGGRSLFISMHGGGGAPPRVNDGQWENQKKLYRPEEGVYLAPRAPTNTWNLWHEGHIDRMFDRLIEDLIVFEDVDPNRVYIMGYSAGGDGVYQLAPRMADRLAAAAMMAGHPNETVPLGLRNLPFTLHMGGEDGAYDRNKVAAEWEKKLADLKAADPEGYEHLVKIHPGKGHWMDREDAVAVPWMAKYTRNPFPKRIVWKQDDVTHDRFYWLAIPTDAQKAGDEIIATIKDQDVVLETGDRREVFVRLNDQLVDLDKPVQVFFGKEEATSAIAPRTIATLAKTLAERGDPASMYSAEIVVK
jgi:poly(3-hydroxybutyrate) depolymerase